MLVFLVFVGGVFNGFLMRYFSGTLEQFLTTMMVSKSGLMTNHDITSTGLIDEGYDGEIVVKLFNHGDENYEIRVGDKISQLVVLPVLYPEVVIVPHLVNGGPRGSHGFGSTGA